jgi:hypothetical protein
MEIATGTRKIALQKNPPRVVIDNEDRIPKRFLTIVPQTTQVNKTTLREALKNEYIPGAHLEQTLGIRYR